MKEDENKNTTKSTKYTK